MIKSILFAAALAALAGIPASAQESMGFGQLLQEANNAFNQGDYISATYYFNRLRETEAWKDYSNKMDVFTKLAFIEESQSNFERAAEYYGLAIQQPPDTTPENKRVIYEHYQKRYANALKMAGHYAQAERLYWKFIDRGGDPETQFLLRQIIEIYGFMNVGGAEMQKLRTLVEEQFFSSLGWDLAELYRLKGDLETSRELFSRLIPENPQEAHQYVSSILAAYESEGRTGELLDDLRERGARHPHFFRLYLELLLRMNQPGRALDELEAHLRAKTGETGELNAGDLSADPSVPDETLVLWTGLLSGQNRLEDAARRAREIVDAFPMNLSWRERLSHFLASAGDAPAAASVWEEWAAQNPDNPLIRFNAAERIQELGMEERAREMILNLPENTPGALRLREGAVCLQLGLYERAMEAFSAAAASGSAGGDAIASSITEALESKTSGAERAAEALIGQATGRAFGDVPVWVRDVLPGLCMKLGMMEELDALAQADPSGLWNIRLAREAMSRGENAWAERWLGSVPAESPHRAAAAQDLARFAGRSNMIPEQRRAAELLEPSVAPLLAASGPVPLTAAQLENLFRYAEHRLNAFEGGKALEAVRTIEASSAVVQRPLMMSDAARISFLRARAMTELGSFQPAIQILDGIQIQPWLTEARFLKAKILLGLKRTEEARELLQALSEDKTHWRRANDAFELAMRIEPLVGESMDLFSSYQLYMLQGRFDAAVPALRELAVAEYGQDTEEWARYETGRLAMISGDSETALETWDELLLDVDHPVYHGLVRYRKWNASGEVNAATGDYQKLLTDFNDTLFADLARIEMRERIREEAP